MARHRDRPTIHDVAAHAQVSAGLVSRYLSGNGSISEASRNRIGQAIKELQYVPSNAARMLRSQSSGVVGIVVPYITNPFFALLAGAAERRFAEHGKITVVASVGATPESTYLERLDRLRLEGLLIFPRTETLPEVVRLHRLGVPVILIERELDLPPTVSLDTVLIDNEAGVYLATRHLLELDHRRVGLIALRRTSLSGPPRLAGYQRALAESHLEIDPHLIIETGGSAEEGYEAMRALLESATPPTGLVLTSNLHTAAAVGYLEEQAWRVPEQLSLVGYGHRGAMAFPWGRLTIVEYPGERLGEIAADLLLRHLEEPNRGFSQRIVIQPRLVVRGSTARLAPEHALLR